MALVDLPTHVHAIHHIQYQSINAAEAPSSSSPFHKQPLALHTKTKKIKTTPQACDREMAYDMFGLPQNSYHGSNRIVGFT